MRRFVLPISFLILLLTAPSAFAQIDLRIAGPQSGFPVALPQLCDAGGAGDLVKQIPEVMGKNLQISGLFNVLNQNSFVETPGRCLKPNEIAFSDWSVIGAEGLVRGEISRSGSKPNSVVVEMYLFDVQQQRAVLGKRYEVDSSEFRRVANRFSNEIIKFFTGEEGIFGSRIAFVSRVGRFKELFIMDVDGSNMRQLTRDRGLALSPSWAPGGDKIIYTSYATRKPDLYTISPAGGAARQLTNKDGLELAAKYTPDGRSLLGSFSHEGETNLVHFDLAGRMVKTLTRSGVIDVSPSFSPDGREVVFCSNRAGGPQIYIMDAAGEDAGRPRRISFTNSNYCTSPAWSPKGDKILFVCRAGGHQLFVINTSGGEATQLTFNGNNEDANWSPDGRYIVFSSDFGRGGARNIALMSLLSGKTTQITFSKSEDSQPAWSPRMD